MLPIHADSYWKDRAFSEIIIIVKNLVLCKTVGEIMLKKKKKQRMKMSKQTQR